MASKTVNRTLKININGKEIELSITNLNKQIRQLKKNLAGTTDPAKRKKYNDELNKTYAARRKINEELRGTQSLLQKVKKQLGPVGSAMLAAFSVATVIAFGNKLIDNIKLFRELKHETKLLTSLQGEMLDSAVSGTKALADTFNTDYKQNLEAANALSKQFGVTYKEALDVMEKGYLAGANTSGDMLNQLKEYAPLMDEANVSLDEMVALITQTEKAGIFNDKGIDAIKEGMLRIREGTNATREAMTDLGLDTKQVYQDLADGNTSYLDVMKLVSTQLNNIEEQSPEVGQAIADIFGGPGEDAGLQYLQSIQDINLELDSLLDPTDEYNILKQEEVRINRELNDVWTDLTTTGGALNEVRLTGLSILSGWLSNINDTSNASKRLEKVLGKGFWSDGLFDSSNYNALGELSVELENIRKTAVNSKDPLLAISEAITGLNESIAAESGTTEASRDRIALYQNEVEILIKENLNYLQTQTKNSETQQQQAEEKEKAANQRKLARENELQAKKSEIQIAADLKKEEREAANQEKRLEKLRESEAEYEAEKIRLKEESDMRAFELEEENRLEEEAQKLDRQILEAESDAERTELVIQQAQFIATEQLKIQMRKDLERAKLANATEAEIFAIKQRYLLAEKKINLDFESEKKQLKVQEVAWEDMTQNQKLDLVRSGLSQAATLFNKNTAAYKAIKISETLMTTYQAAMNSYNALSVIPIVGPVLGGVAAAAAVVAGLTQVRKIASTDTKKLPRYAQGGPTSSLGFADGSGHDVAGVVHADEYVIPKFVLQDNSDPVVPAVMQYLEAKRTGQSFVDGGSTTVDAIPSSGEGSSINVSGSNDTQMEVMAAILYRLENPLLAPVLIGDDEIARQNSRSNVLNQTRENAKIS